MKAECKKRLLYIVNVDWYFYLHWLDRAVSAKNDGFEVHVAARLTSIDIMKKLKVAGLHVHDLSLERRSINPLKEMCCFWRTLRLITKIKPDVCHAITLKPVLYAGTVHRLQRRAAVLSLPGLGLLSKNSGLGGRLAWSLLKVSLSWVLRGRNIPMFENVQDSETLLGGSSKSLATLVPGAGVDLHLFSPKPEPECEIVRVLFAARLLKSKGLGNLVEAIARLKANAVPVELHVAGIIDEDAFSAISLVDIEQWATNKDIIWHGSVSDMANLISLCHIVALPTTYGEGIPRILIEGAACGRSVIATNISGCNEFILHGVDGYVVEPDDIESLCEAIKKLVHSPELRKKFGQAGRDKVASRYSNDRVINLTLDAYKSLIV